MLPKKYKEIVKIFFFLIILTIELFYYTSYININCTLNTFNKERKTFKFREHKICSKMYDYCINYTFY